MSLAIIIIIIIIMIIKIATTRITDLQNSLYVKYQILYLFENYE
jgi:hypothetical protein